jgi:hypothetical protein
MRSGVLTGFDGADEVRGFIWRGEAGTATGTGGGGTDNGATVSSLFMCFSPEEDIGTTREIERVTVDAGGVVEIATGTFLDTGDTGRG